MAPQVTLFSCSLAFLNNCSVLSCIQNGTVFFFYAVCGWRDFLSFIHLKQKNDNLKFVWIKQMDFYNI